PGGRPPGQQTAAGLRPSERPVCGEVPQWPRSAAGFRGVAPRASTAQRASGPVSGRCAGEVPQWARSAAGGSGGSPSGPAQRSGSSGGPAPGPAQHPPSRHGTLTFVRVYLGSDHAGFELKSHLVAWLSGAGHEPVDCGPPVNQEDDDYPPYVMRAADSVVKDPGSLGMVIGGSGNGEQIASNKIPGVRAAVAWTVETAQLARQHNDANVLSLGARMYPVD